MSISGEQMESYEKKVTPNMMREAAGLPSVENKTITISMEDYNDLIETRGRYYEIKDEEVESEAMMEEYKELLVIKGKYEELSAMFDSQQLTEGCPSQGIVPKVMLCKDEMPAYDHSYDPRPDANGNGSCKGM